MTGYTVHTGSSEKFTEGWDRIFRDKSKKKAATSSQKITGKAKRKRKKKAK